MALKELILTLFYVAYWCNTLPKYDLVLWCFYVIANEENLLPL